MYKTEIQVNGKNIPIRFGAYVIKCLADVGIKVTELSEPFDNNPADIMSKIIYYGALNASENREGKGISINDIYDWMDEVEGGLFGEKVREVILLFQNQMTDGVPKNAIAEGKTPHPKK